MEKRRLGRTGHMSTVVTFGAIAIGKKEDDQEAAERFRPLGQSAQREIVDSQSPPYPEPGLGILPAT